MITLSPSDSITASFEEVVSRFPDLCAMRWCDGSWSYAELNARANRLAHFLIAAGVRAEAPVGVFALRSPETLVAFLAILKAGGVYVSLDPSYPADRTKYCIEDAAVQLVLADPDGISRLPATAAKVVALHSDVAKGQPDTNPKCETWQGSAAHIFYTSGSTGRPKGVVIEHRGVLRLAKHLDYVNVGPGETLLQFTPLNYDVSTFEIWCSWLNGACLAVPPAGLTSLHDIGLAFRTYNVSLMLLPSSLLPLMVEQELDSLAGVRQLVVGGDVVSTAHAARFLKAYPESRMVNAYGPTENTVITSCQRIHLENPMPARLSIGRPIQKTQVLIMDEKLQPVPAGEVGEIVMTGEGLARGYLNQPDLTAERFIEITDPSGKKVRAYRSGDLGLYNPDGTLDFRGRMDDQVKINGLRIELGEIRSVLQSHPRVAEAEAIVVEQDGKKRLETFAVAKPGMELEERELRDFLEQKVPGNWRPSALRIVRSLPRGPSGKVDRRALIASLAAVPVARNAQPEHEPDDHLEKAIWNIWRDILPGTPIKRNDRYSDLGGDSLSALQMIARVEKMVGRTIGLRPLLEGGTIADIAAAARDTGPASPPPMILCMQGGSKPPFFFAHGDYTCGGLYCQKMAQKLGSDQPFYAIAPEGTFGGELPASVEEASASVVELIRSVQPKGPYYLGGYCNGALVIYEAAQQLIRSGEKISSLVLLDPPDLYLFLLRRKIAALGRILGLSERHGRNAYQRIAEGMEIWQAHGLLRLITAFFDRGVVWLGKKYKEFFRLAKVDTAPNLNNHYYNVIADYEPQSYLATDSAWIILREGESPRRPKQVSYWTSFIPGAHFEIVPGTHLELQSSMEEIAAVTRAALKEGAGECD